MAATDSRFPMISSGLLALAAAGLWAAGRMSWVKVTAADDKLGSVTRTLDGGTWSAETTIVSLILAAAVVALLVVSPAAKRIVGVLAAAAAAAASFSAVGVLTTGAAADRARDLLVTGAANQKSTDPTALTQWATVTGVSVSPAGPLLAVVACAVGLVAGILVVVNPGSKKEATSRFDHTAARREMLEEDLDRTPDSGRVIWDALDNGVDPTADEPGKP